MGYPNNKLIIFWFLKIYITALVSLIQDVERDFKVLPLLQILTMVYGVQGRVLRRRGRWARVGRHQMAPEREDAQ